MKAKFINDRFRFFELSIHVTHGDSYFIQDFLHIIQALASFRIYKFTSLNLVHSGKNTLQACTNRIITVLCYVLDCCNHGSSFLQTDTCIIRL